MVFQFSALWPLIPLVGRLKAREGRIEKTDTQTHTQNDYFNPRCACTLRVNDWINICDRGGLLRVNDEAFAVNRWLDNIFIKTRPPTYSLEAEKSYICATIVMDEDVLFYWYIVAADMDEENATTLLQMIVESWVTIRGFSFAGAWVELYKQRTKKTLKHSKGIRKALFTSKTESL